MEASVAFCPLYKMAQSNIYYQYKMMLYMALLISRCSQQQLKQIKRAWT